MAGPSNDSGSDSLQSLPDQATSSLQSPLRLRPEDAPSASLLEQFNSILESTSSASSGDCADADFVLACLQAGIVLSWQTNQYARVDPKRDVAIGEGSNYQVWRKKIKLDGRKTTVAVKRLKGNWFPTGSASFSKSGPQVQLSRWRPMIRDIVVMRIGKTCSTILGLHGASVDFDHRTGTQTPFLIVELSTAGSLVQFLGIKRIEEQDKASIDSLVASSLRCWSWEVRKGLVTDVADALGFLHSHSIYHTDVKPHNVLVFGGGRRTRYLAKLADFGSALVFNPDSPDRPFPLGRDSGGTQGYLAPECHALSNTALLLKWEQKDLRKLDVFAFGVLLVECLTSCSVQGAPFGGHMSYATTLQQLTFMRNLDLLDAGQIDQIFSLVQGCLCSAEFRLDSFASILPLLRGQANGTSDLTKTLISNDAQVKLDLIHQDLVVDQMMTSVTSMTSVLDSVELDRKEFDLKGLLEEHPMRMMDAYQPFQVFLEFSNTENPFISKLAQIEAALPRDSTKTQVFLALSHILGGKPVDFDRCEELLLDCARRDFLPAKMVYRRMHGAMFSIDSLAALSNSPMLEHNFSPLAIQEIDRVVFEDLQLLEEKHADNFLANMLCLHSRYYWSDEVQRALDVKTNSTTLSSIRSWNGRQTPPDNHIACDLLRSAIAGLGDIQVDGHLQSLQVTDYDYIIAGALLFDEGVSVLSSACEALAERKIPLCFYFESISSENALSPLMLACRIGRADCVRVLCRHSQAAAAWSASMTTLECEGGIIPLHHLFMFQDDEIIEMHSLLSEGVEPKAMPTVVDICPSQPIIILRGTPLEVALKVGSEPAAKLLWQGLRTSNLGVEAGASYLSFGLSIGNGHAKRPTSAPNVRRTPIVEVALGCMASCQPRVWRTFLAQLGQDGVSELRTSMRALSGMEVSAAEVGMSTWLLAIQGIRGAQLTNMLLHGPMYTKSLASQLEAILRFLDPGEIVAPLPHSSFREPHFDLALLSAYVVTRQDEKSRWDRERIEKHLADFFRERTELVLQRPGSGLPLGFMLSKAQSVHDIIDGMLAATLASDMASTKRVVQACRLHRIDLVTSGGLHRLIAGFIKRPSNYAKECIELVAACYFSQSGGNLSKERDRFLERDASESSQFLWDAIHYNNLEMILYSLERDPAGLAHRDVEPGALEILCTNDYYAPTLRHVLEHLDPTACRKAILLRTEVTRMTLIDVAIYHRSSQCLAALARFMASEAVKFDIEAAFHQQFYVARHLIEDLWLCGKFVGLISALLTFPFWMFSSYNRHVRHMEVLEGKAAHRIYMLGKFWTEVLPLNSECRKKAQAVLDILDPGDFNIMRRHTNYSGPPWNVLIATNWRIVGSVHEASEAYVAVALGNLIKYCRAWVGLTRGPLGLSIPRSMKTVLGRLRLLVWCVRMTFWVLLWWCGVAALPGNVV